MPGAFPGLPTGTGIHPVSNLGGFSEDFYVPPQRGTYSLFASIINNGPQTVTIETVWLAVAGTSSWPLTLTAPVRYSRAGWDGSSQLPPPDLARSAGGTAGTGPADLPRVSGAVLTMRAHRRVDRGTVVLPAS